MTLQELIKKYNDGQSKYILQERKDTVEIKDTITFIPFNISIYDFIFNPKYGFLDFFYADKDVKVDFWEWMKKKKNGHIDHDIKYITMHHNRNQSSSFLAIPILLEGYIRQYVEQMIQGE